MLKVKIDNIPSLKSHCLNENRPMAVYVMNMLLNERLKYYRIWENQSYTDKQWFDMIKEKINQFKKGRPLNEKTSKELLECTAIMFAWFEDVILNRESDK